MSTLRVVRAALLYCGIVFACGFALGTVRTLWLAPLLGAGRAELLELPLMLVVVLWAAGVVAARLARPTRARCAAVGSLAVGLLLAAEIALVWSVRRMTLAEYVETRDPLAGTLYLASLAVMAAAPAARRPRGART